MNKYEVDLSLIYTSSLISNATKERILEELLRENKLKYEKYYCLPDDRNARVKAGKNVITKDKTLIYVFSCTENMYDFILYLLKKRLNTIDKLNSSF